MNDIAHDVKTEYKVNKEKRTIVCIITAINDVPFKLAKYGLADEEYEDIVLDIRIYKGIAKCSLEDEWDENYGKRLAEYRASRARQVDVNAELKAYINGVSKCIDNLYDYGLIKNPHKPEEK
jgi:hypothetical protein